MKKQLTYLTLLGLFLWVPGKAQQFISVSSAGQPPYDDMTRLIHDYFTGSGIEIINVESNNDPRAVGYFSDGDTAIGLNRGLVLSSGFVNDITEEGNVFASNLNGGNTILPELQAIATSTLNDATYFRITFRPFNDSIHFRYVFASEEYPEYACTSFNDVFGFFLSGPNPQGGVYNDLNLALIPGTNLPVSINNLHPDNSANYPPCPPNNVQYYHDNYQSNIQPVFDGFSDVFVAAARVVPCATYEILIALADVGDAAYDSGVFLEAKSLESSVIISSSLGTGESIVPEVAIADTISFTFTEVPANLLPMHISITGTASNGIDYQMVDSVTQINSPGQVVKFVIQPIQDTLLEQLETVLFNIYGEGQSECFSQTFTLYIADPDSLYSPVETVAFLASGNAFLSVAPTAVSNKQWTFSNTNATPIPTGALLQSGITIDVPFDLLHDLSILQSVCLNIDHAWDDELDIYLIAPNGTNVELSTDNGGNGDDYTNTCFSPAATESIRGNLPFAPASKAPFTGLFQPEGFWNDILGTPISGTWKLGVQDDLNNINGTLLNWSIQFSTYELGNFKYQWNTGETTPSILASTPGNYSVTVSNELGAFAQAFVVKESNVGTETPSSAAPIFHISPNPSNGAAALILDQNVEVRALKVYDLNGVLMLNQNHAGNIQGVETLASGIYVVVLECSEGTFVQKMLR